MGYTRAPFLSNGIEIYPNSAAFPTVGILNGSQAVAADTDTIYIWNGTAWVVVAMPGEGTGTVQSVGLALPVSVFTISGSPVTVTGTLTGSFNTQSANTVFAGPTTGAASVPAFRALVAADLPVGNLIDAGTDGIVVTSGTGAVIGAGTSIAQHVADTTHNGYLSSVDWNTFNSKQTTLTPGNISTSTTGVTVGSGTSSTVGPNVTVDIQTASGSQPGLLSAADWTTFNGKQSTLTLGNLTDVGTDGIVVTGGTGAIIGSGTSLAQHIADTTHNGYLSSTDWNTFNGKQAVGSYITALTGDGTASGPGSVAFTLATVNSNVGSFGSSTAIPVFTVNGKGLITAASTNAVIAPAGTLSGTILNATVVSSFLTSVGTIATGVWNGTTIAIANGGTAKTSVTTTPAATSWAGWDANNNLSANNLIQGYATFSVNLTNTVLTVSSAGLQYFTGSNGASGSIAQACYMPVESTLVTGMTWTIVNNCTNNNVIQVVSSNASTIILLASGSEVTLTCINTGVTTAAAWSISSNVVGNGAPTLVNGSTSGSANFLQPFQTPGYKQVVVYLSALLGTASYTFPVAFAHTPAVVTTNEVAGGVATSLSTTAVTLTGTTTTGYLFIQGF